MKRSFISLFAVMAIFAMTVASITSLNSCATLNALAGLARAEFMIQNAVNVNLMGINLAGKHSLSDFSVMDGINLLSSFNSGKMPLTFTLNVAARNPNKPDPNVNLSSFSLAQFPYRLLLDGRETISGGIGAPVSLPAGGQTVVIPLQASLDLKQFFADKGYNDVANLALALAGQGGASHVQLKAQPKISTPIGNMTYPHELTIVNTEFRSN
ncbi:MAG TPA: LEA type 2 family protein [Candidatus Kapabacteria bacterium]|nr:LEA type 2 family protein [Candidatus Kapabacteria bacterium]